jgi:hypothetical protein
VLQWMAGDPARIDTALDSRSITFENPTGGRGAGGTAAAGRKGAPMQVIAAGQHVTWRTSRDRAPSVTSG